MLRLKTLQVSLEENKVSSKQLFISNTFALFAEEKKEEVWDLYDWASAGDFITRVDCTIAEVLTFKAQMFPVDTLCKQ